MGQRTPAKPTTYTKNKKKDSGMTADLTCPYIKKRRKNQGWKRVIFRKAFWSVCVCLGSCVCVCVCVCVRSAAALEIAGRVCTSHMLAAGSDWRWLAVPDTRRLQGQRPWAPTQYVVQRCSGVAIVGWAVRGCSGLNSCLQVCTAEF